MKHYTRCCVSRAEADGLWHAAIDQVKTEAETDVSLHGCDRFRYDLVLFENQNFPPKDSLYADF